MNEDIEIENDIELEKIENSLIAIDTILHMSLIKLEELFKNKNDRIEALKLINNKITERILDSLKE
jgi:hypothetical protein